LYRECAHLIVDTGSQSIARLTTSLEYDLNQFKQQRQPVSSN